MLKSLSAGESEAQKLCSPPVLAAAGGVPEQPLLRDLTPARPGTGMLLHPSLSPWSGSAGGTPPQDSFLKGAAGLSARVQL